jgi:hypothetical protein
MEHTYLGWIYKISLMIVRLEGMLSLPFITFLLLLFICQKTERRVEFIIAGGGGGTSLQHFFHINTANKMSKIATPIMIPIMVTVSSRIVDESIYIYEQTPSLRR